MSSPLPRLLVLDRTNELAARLRHNVVAPRTVVKACPDAGRAEALLAAYHWDVVIAGPSLMHRGGLVLRARRVWVVIDTHEGLSDIFTAALDATDHVFAVATPDRPSLVNLDRFLRALERLGLAPGNVSVVLNKAEDAGPMAIPYSRDVLRSVNVGVPLIVGKPKATISGLLTTLLSDALPKARKAQRPNPVVIEAVPDTIEPLEAEIEPEIDLRAPEPMVWLLLTDDGPIEFALAESPSCRGRGPPRPISPRLHPSLVPSLVTK